MYWPWSILKSFGINKSITAKNMPECGFSLNLILPDKERIVDSVLVRENMGQRKHAFCIFYTVHAQNQEDFFEGQLVL